MRCSKSGRRRDQHSPNAIRRYSRRQIGQRVGTVPMFKNLLIFSLLVHCGVVSAALQIQDDEGRVLTLPAPALRIVSLAPGATAMLFAAGAGARVVGTAEYSDEPEAARRIPRVGDSQGFDTERIL